MVLRRNRRDRNVIDAKTVREKWDKAVRATRTEREIAAVNTAFIENRQWVFWNRHLNRLEDVPRDPQRMRVSINRLGATTDVILAKLMRRPLVFEVPPTSPDDAAVLASRIGEAALADAHRRLNWERVREDHACCVWEHGVGGLMVEWDSKYGEPVGEDPETGEILYTGEVCVRAVSMHEMAFEPGTRDGEHALWWIYAVALPPPEVQEMFGLEKEPAADARAIDNVYRYTDGSKSENTPLTMVYRYWERPHGDFPGITLTVVGDQVVERGPWPFPWTDRLNICLAVGKVRHGKWWGHTPVTDAIGPQALYNAAHSSIGEHLKKAGNARLAVPIGSIDDEEELTDEPGEFLPYNPINGLAPSWLAPAAMPDWWARYPVMIEGMMDDLLHIHEVSRGDNPPGVESGVALSVLLEADDSPTGKLAKELGDCWGRAASLVLKLWEKKVTERRRAIIQLPGGVPEAIEWMGEDLQGQTTAVVPHEAVMPRSRAAQNAFALSLWDRQIIQSPHDLAKIADLPDQDDFLAGLDPDSARAQRENYAMSTGIPRTVAPYDDHRNHIVWHRNFMRSERFEYLPLEVQQIVLEHVQAHEVFAGQVAAEQAQAAVVSPIAAALPTGEAKTLPADDLQQAAELAQFAAEAVAGDVAGAMPPGEGAPILPGEGPAPGTAAEAMPEQIPAAQAGQPPTPPPEGAPNV